MITKIRSGNHNDIPKIAELLIKTWRASYIDFMPAEFLANLNVEKQIQRHERYMSSNTQYFVAENEVMELVGFSSYGKNRMEHISSDFELYTIYVHHKYQGKGIGQQLLNAVLNDIHQPESKIAVTVFQLNPFAQFYLKNGFKKVNEEIINLGTFELVSDIYTMSASR